MDTIEPTPGEHLVYDERPQWFKDWESTGLLKFDDKNSDGKIQYLADAEVNEMVKVDPDIMVLANPAIANLPNWVIALVAAGGLAAAAKMLEEKAAYKQVFIENGHKRYG